MVSLVFAAVLFAAKVDPATRVRIVHVPNAGEAADGVSLVAWRHEDEVGWQLYSEDGKPLGAPGSIQSPGKGVAAVVDRERRFLLLQ